MKIFYMDDPKKNTHEACCPDMNIEDVVLSNKIGYFAMLQIMECFMV